MLMKKLYIIKNTDKTERLNQISRRWTSVVCKVGLRVDFVAC